ncbi:response regulator [Tahibacter soli]|jgi:DNA-binding NarL/FixJ family response regulator|uniref:Response regulator transcription factor n=1 Tax=Tahibacter soli TaxID=2983605 RepID=A0A9X3YLE6_9GAMM|nr:response regulator transcription factor [Tahibacter soli]MDC8012858.1 response regulator transcription factor [Tahibacter soli]
MRVLLADDHTLVRAGIRRLLESVEDIEVVAEADNGNAVSDLVALKHPDVALIDLSMPGKNGLEVAAELRRRFPETVVVIMSMHADVSYVRTALDNGAAGFVVKEAAPAELELALRAACAGQTFLSPKVSSRMLDTYVRRGRASGLDALSPRQREILALMARGRATKEIAADLGISAKTVETHRARMMEILGVRRSAELLRLAVQSSLGG